jgi:putative membrane protein
MNRKEIILSGVLIIFYLVGIIGTHLSFSKTLFFSLSYFNLLLSFVILISARKFKGKLFWGFVLFAFLIGMIVEWIGVHTALLFGNYSYGENLGFKLFEVPLVIGLNWVMLTIITSSVVNRLKIGVSAKVFTSALTMTLFDGLMEPVAINADFWSWIGGVIPLFNYVCWFLISLGLQTVYFRLKLEESNKIHDLLLLNMVIFFVSLILF